MTTELELAINRVAKLALPHGGMERVLLEIDLRRLVGLPETEGSP